MQTDLSPYLASQFSDYLSDAALVGNQDIENLENLVSQYPYCQPLHMLAAKAAVGTPNFEDKLEKAAIYTSSREVLFEMIAVGDGLRAVGSELSGFEPREAGDGLSGSELLDQPQQTTIETPLPTAEQAARGSQPEAEIPQIETYDHHDSVLIKEIEEDAISAINIQQSEITQAARGPQPESPRLEEAPSLYNDDKLPFTFLWWLNKTRKEHYENNQPFINPQPAAQSPSLETRNSQAETYIPQLNHQIAENILQLGALDNYKNHPTNPEPITKEDHIIKKFISDEPQIKPLTANKIDTENKAKTSSADGGELVSETLAKIYVEQMLYAKALETYKKLSLKYPEKSTYFASQIKYLELKVN